MIFRKMIHSILIICFVMVLILIYQNQITHKADELEIINESTPIVYASGSLINSAKEYLVDHIYEEADSPLILNKLLALDAKLLIFLNDELIHVKTILDTASFSYYNQENNELTFHYEDESVLVEQFDDAFYYLMGEYIHQNMNDLNYDTVINETYESIIATDLPLWHGLLEDRSDYFAECIRMFYLDPSFLQTHAPSYTLITSVLSTIGLK